MKAHCWDKINTFYEIKVRTGYEELWQYVTNYKFSYDLLSCVLYKVINLEPCSSCIRFDRTSRSEINRLNTILIDNFSQIFQQFELNIDLIDFPSYCTLFIINVLISLSRFLSGLMSNNHFIFHCELLLRLKRSNSILRIVFSELICLFSGIFAYCFS